MEQVEVDVEQLGKSRFLNLLLKPAGAAMESRMRHRLFNPIKTLQGADLKRGQAVLEVGCGTEFFTLPAAEMIGDTGRLIAIDPLMDYVDRVTE